MTRDGSSCRCGYIEYFAPPAPDYPAEWRPPSTGLWLSAFMLGTVLGLLLAEVLR